MSITIDPPPDKPPLLRKLKRQRGPRAKSTDPAFRRDVGLGIAEDRNKRNLILVCRHFTRKLLETGSATADDCASFEDGGKRRVFIGAALRKLHVAGVCIPDGWQPSSIPRNHSRPVVRWLLADADVARGWLAANPDPDPLAPPTQRELFAEEFAGAHKFGADA